MTNDASPFEDLKRRIQLLSRDAFELAREGDPGDDEAERERARDLDGKLGELLGPLEALPNDERSAILGEWNDARLDVGYVLAGRRGPMSTRLGRWLESTGNAGGGPEPPTVS
jgi:hypothetical protein